MTIKRHMFSGGIRDSTAAANGDDDNHNNDKRATSPPALSSAAASWETRTTTTMITMATAMTALPVPVESTGDAVLVSQLAH